MMNWESGLITHGCELITSLSSVFFVPSWFIHIQGARPSLHPDFNQSLYSAPSMGAKPCRWIFSVITRGSINCAK